MRKMLILLPIGLLLLCMPALAMAGKHRHHPHVTNKIVPFKSIGGFSLGITPAQVKKRLGKPSHTIKVSGKIAQMDYYGGDLVFEFDTLHKGDPANLIGANSRRWRTSKGIRVGSTRKQVKRAYRSVKWSDGGYSMWKGKPGANGSRMTGFDFLNGRVDGITVQKVFNDG